MLDVPPVYYKIIPERYSFWELYFPIVVVGEVVALLIMVFWIKKLSELTLKQAMMVAFVAITVSFAFGLFW